ncbi:hypothetical protein EAS56_25580 [Bradyrhizobium guangzhouense]|uniref:DUF5681 domain-containing protein n=1 Tax=Bradyrhizobium guangzhouense TaxID=1325095 RepID=A0ABY0E0U8_9BRAD|nr:DUF5681 domain-containing protein [Bradyrhizobium guangzhouense]RXH09669.1 hypothetical protein EAS56_25580 [Bradyrhizobium guangzhouense]
MSRNVKGQFEKGTTGNPKGRPRKQLRSISDEEVRRAFFEAEDTLVPIVVGNKREMIPASVAIDKQLIFKAASGDPRSMMLYYKRKDRFVLEYVEQQMRNLRALVEAQERIRDFPEDVTDEFKRAVQLLQFKIDKSYLL